MTRKRVLSLVPATGFHHLVGQVTDAFQQCGVRMDLEELAALPLTEGT